jgi:hypothetical protein
VSRFRFIAAEKANSSVVRLCRALGVSTSGFYDWQHHQPSARARTDAVLVDRIRDVHAVSHCTYGAPRVHAELRATGTRVGKKRVARLMRTAGLAGRCPKRFRRTTIRSTTPAAEPPAATPATSVVRPLAMAAQKRCRSSRRATGGRPGDCIRARSARSDRRRFGRGIAFPSAGVARTP